MPNRRERLDNLLTNAIEAHGGLVAWNKLQTLRANVSIGGALWDLRGVPGLFKNIQVELKLHSQEVTTHLFRTSNRPLTTSNTPHKSPETQVSTVSKFKADLYTYSNSSFTK